MNRLLIAALAAAGSTAGCTAAWAAPAPFTPDQAHRIQCVAQLSIIASEQQNGVASALAYPPLADDGARFAQWVGERLMTESKRTKEQVRDAFVAGVAAEQTRATAGGAAREIPRGEVVACIALMEKLAPAPPPPSLPQCAAMVKIASDEVHAREGLSGGAKDLATIAAVLDARARDQLLGSGQSREETEKVMAKTRAEIAREAARRAADEVSAGLDFQACFDMAKE